MNLIWTEKYRPKKLDDMIGQDVDKVRRLVEDPLSMPHFLFISKSPGTGKTSYAHAIIGEIKAPMTDVLFMNSSDERKLETIRTTVKDFATTLRRKKDVPRIVIMDEFDGMLSASQDALRFIMEKYSSNCKFILTANSEEKIIDAIKSRCVVIKVKETDRTDIMKRLLYICKQENIVTQDESLVKIIDIHYPDIRAMINHIQEISGTGKISIDMVKTRMEQEEMFYELIKKRNPFEVRTFVIQSGIDPRDLLHFVLDRMLTDENLKPKPVGLSLDAQTYKTQMNNTIMFGAEIDYRMAVGADPEIQLFAFILKYMSIWK